MSNPTEQLSSGTALCYVQGSLSHPVFRVTCKVRIITVSSIQIGNSGLEKISDFPQVKQRFVELEYELISGTLLYTPRIIFRTRLQCQLARVLERKTSSLGKYSRNSL